MSHSLISHSLLIYSTDSDGSVCTLDATQSDQPFSVDIPLQILMAQYANLMPCSLISHSLLIYSIDSDGSVCTLDATQSDQPFSVDILYRF